MAEPRELLPVSGDYTATSIDMALDLYERAWSEEAYENLTVLERRPQPGGTILVRYEVHWKHSIFDDYAYGLHEGWARVATLRGRRVMFWVREKLYRVVAAEGEHHMRR